MKSFAICTLGCKVNSYESESYYQQLIKLGYVYRDFKEVADIYIINTCTVTDTASAKSRKMIQRCARLNPKAYLCVVGCYAQTSKDLLKDKYQIDLIIGSQQKDKLVEFLVSGVKETDLVKPLVSPVFESLTVDSFKHTRAYLKIQDGCNQYCSYCIIPYARGKERSLALNAAINEANKLALNHQELVLAGIHTGRYGGDNNTNLVELLKELIKIEGLKRIRLSSIEVNEISDELISLFKESSKLARHLHIPLQSGSDDILKVMNRPYTCLEYFDKIVKIREALPNISISTDVIVGFPGEDQEEWLNSKAFIEKCNFSFLHVFPFSKRKFTKAFDMVNQVSDYDKKERVNELLAHSKEQLTKYASSFVGKEVEVLIEDGKKGYCSEYLVVNLLQEDLKNSLVKVIVKDSKSGELLA